VTNWAEYDAALRARGSLTVWFTPEAVAAWAAAARLTRGGQPTYSNLAIATALTLQAVFRLALRQTESLIGSVLQLLGLDLPVPDYSTLSRRADTLEVPRPKAGSAPVHLLVDSTGLKLCGAGDWLAEKHGTKRRRAWRVLHLATDADTGRIVASVLTDKDADDGSQVGSLLDRIDGRWRPSPATVPTTATTSTPRSRHAIPTQPLCGPVCVRIWIGSLHVAFASRWNCSVATEPKAIWRPVWTRPTLWRSACAAMPLNCGR
jgi:hypothetical protein